MALPVGAASLRWGPHPYVAGLMALPVDETLMALPVGAASLCCGLNGTIVL
jgi:hypothetical protein